MSNQAIIESTSAFKSVISVLDHHGIDYTHLSADQMVDLARGYSAPCNHDWDRAYHGAGTRVCKKCGGLQDN